MSIEAENIEHEFSLEDKLDEIILLLKIRITQQNELHDSTTNENDIEEF